jgi:hypothetical protein
LWTLLLPTTTTLPTTNTHTATAQQQQLLLIQLLPPIILTTKQIDGFSIISMNKKENGTSFIIIKKGIEIDDLQDESLSVVPTLMEAEDTLEMDDIERDLSF